MRFDKEKKNAIVQYLLEKMADETPNLVKHVSETLDINQNTVHTYIKELLSDGVIRRVKRGTYELVSETASYTLSRSRGEIQAEERIYSTLLLPHLKMLPANVLGCWDYILSEMINNVIDHSEAKNLHITVKQNRLTTQVFIIDDGIGIFKKIMDHFNMPSLDDAVCELFKGKLTTAPEYHSGEGIFFSSKIADRFSILSDGKFFANNKYDIDYLWDGPTDLPGTAVLIELSNSSNKVTAEIFGQYSEVDRGFTKTVIPLKNIFESAPVSRSQAKRVCQRLEEFQEVVLDFDGLDWMGQGFAHQIFIVFQNQHPDITLSPINMCEAVEKMYFHVVNRTY